MPDPIVRLKNIVALCKAEPVEGVDAVPVANVDAFPFEIESLTVGDPYTMNPSNESTGTEIQGIPEILAQLAPVTIKMRLKGAGAGVTYSASVKPPMHALLQSTGLRGLFQAAITGVTSSAGTAISSTLGATFVATAQAYRGMRLVLTGAGTGTGAHPLISDYSAGKVATLTDTFTPALDATTVANLIANWTYAATSPAMAAERTADQPSSTLYLHGDGILTKLFGFRGSPKIMVDTAKPGYFEISGSAIWGGQTNVAQPTNAVIPLHAAPTFQQGSAISAAFLVNRKKLPISNFSFDWARQVNTYEDPNTGIGFGAAQIEERAAMLECDPYTNQDLTVRHAIAELEATIGGAANFTAGARAGAVSGNRWALCVPNMQMVKAGRITRNGARADALGFRAFSSGRDAVGRDGDAIIVFD